MTPSEFRRKIHIAGAFAVSDKEFRELALVICLKALESCQEDYTPGVRLVRELLGSGEVPYVAD